MSKKATILGLSILEKEHLVMGHGYSILMEAAIYIQLQSFQAKELISQE